MEGKQNSLFPEGPVIKCFVILPDSNTGKKLRKNDLLVAYELYEGCALQYERQSNRALLPKRHNDSLFLRS